MWETFKKNKKINEPITIATPHGKLTVVRNIDYCPSCGKTYGQNDDVLGINKVHRVTKDFHEIVTYVAQMIPGFINSKEVLFKTKGIEVSATQIKILTEEVGEGLFEMQMDKALQAYSEPEKAAPALLERYRKDTILYILMDGSAVNTRVQDEDGSTWKEMKLGLTFLDKDVIKRKNNSGIIAKKEYVTYLGSVNEFKKVLFDSASRSGYGKVKKVVIIADGAHWIWNLSKELFPDAEFILDFFHMTENIYDYAKALFNNNEKKYNKWAKTVIHYIKTEQVKKALRKISENPLSSDKIDKTVNLAGYLQNNIDKINYLQYKNKGYYVGSGMIESGNKIVVQKRMKQAGMRWSIKGAQYMAVLRAKHESGKWSDVENYLNFMQKTA